MESDEAPADDAGIYQHDDDHNGYVHNDDDNDDVNDDDDDDDYDGDDDDDQTHPASTPCECETRFFSWRIEISH